MVPGKARNSQKGFTLFELLGVAMIMGILTFASIYLYNSARSRSQSAESRERLNLIAAKIKQYYQSHEKMPQDLTRQTEVPVGPDLLDMEQKYRLDAWGQYFTYTMDENGDIRGIEGYAASIRSNGPDQDPNLTQDNIIVYIDVTAEARRITQKKLKVLQEKVAAYDALFSGVDNDGNGTVDDRASLWRAAALRSLPALDGDCPPTKNFSNDPSQGLSTLDAIENHKGKDYNCSGFVIPSPLIRNIVHHYALPGSYLEDPWGHPFHWGFNGRERDGGSVITTSDPRYHHFYSSGPDTDRIEDDIIFSAE
jgi:Tfp pilus assembly protein PilE